MKKAYIFPGQGSQFPGMAKDLYEGNEKARQMLERANEVLGFRITDIMFNGTADDLKQTDVTQPAIFLHSVVLAACLPDFQPDMVAGHSLGEFSALVAAGAMDFEEGLKLVAIRARAMQKACEAAPSTMAAIIGLPDEKIEEICSEISKEGYIVVPANYNNPGQLVISGNVEAINEACEKLKAAGAKRALPLPVGGAFHSPLMQIAKDELQAAIEATEFSSPRIPVYQNVDAKGHTNPEEIKTNLIAQLTAPVRWTNEVENMIADGDQTILKQVFVLFQLFLAVDMQAMAHPHDDGQHRILADMQQCPLALKEKAFLYSGTWQISSINLPEEFSSKSITI